ncbi:YbaB/EbfC family nucleoid-associated protein [Nocardia sp. NBC_00881]|uniref:YbaB/EbfC family nucleoid-associated protein n=1 Tax=Nocardia sp. NBC_00881 TaxID=2975995 RepID=UPI00386A12B5|nr:YbaB/EbfC family nucleoid-associated protein [Nocardia sp. NBC_00881]
MTDNEMSAARLTDLVDSVQAGMKSIENMQRRWMLLTATGSGGNRRVTVSINAEGTVIETHFTDDIGDLSYEEIAKAVTEAAQNAATEMQRKTAELSDSLQEHSSRVPKLSELAPGAVDILDLVPAAPQVSLAPLGSPERLAAESEAMEFTDTEQLDRDASQSGVTDSSW